MQVIEERIDVKSMKPSLLTQTSVHTIAIADDKWRATRFYMGERVCTFSLTAYCWTF